MSAEMSAKRFRVAFSFAGEKREFVEQVAAILAKRFGEAAILYDKYHEAEFARDDLASICPTLYHEEADLIVVVFCPDYDKKDGAAWNGRPSSISSRTRESRSHAGPLRRRDGRGLYPRRLRRSRPQNAGASRHAHPRTPRPERRQTQGSLHRRHCGRQRAPRTSIPNNLPRLQYFFGRETELKEIADALAPEARGWGALIDGPGGIGKTALAIRAAESVPSGRFRRIIFLSSKERELTADGQRALGHFVVPSYLEMLNAIARELGQADFTKSPESRTPRAILRALRDAEVLLVLDNLETLPEPDRDQLFAFLNRLPRGSSAIVTSRRRADASAVVVRLDRLDWQAARALLAELGRDFPTAPPGQRRPTVVPSTRRPAAIPCSSAGSRANSVSAAAATSPPRWISSAAPRRATTRWSSSSATCWTPSPRTRPKSSPRSPISPRPWR